MLPGGTAHVYRLNRRRYASWYCTYRGLGGTAATISRSVALAWSSSSSKPSSADSASTAKRTAASLITLQGFRHGTEEGGIKREHGGDSGNK